MNDTTRRGLEPDVPPPRPPAPPDEMSDGDLEAVSAGKAYGYGYGYPGRYGGYPRIYRTGIGRRPY